jgi:hypothetical protein
VSQAKPLYVIWRLANYARQHPGRPLTGRQHRRVKHKLNRYRKLGLEPES